MSFAVLSLVGLEGAPLAIAGDVLVGLRDACQLKQPIGRWLLLCSPEAVRLVRRVELVDEYNASGLYGLAKRVARQPTHGDWLLVVGIGDHGPRVRRIPFAPVRAIFAEAARVEERSRKERGSDHGRCSE